MRAERGIVYTLCCGAALLMAGAADAQQTLLFEESFEDTQWTARGWYDGPHMEITADEHIPGSGHSCAWRWDHATAVGTVGGGARLHLPPVDDVTLVYHIKHSQDWTWTGVPWHPHEFHFITNADDEYVGPAYTHLTFYVEAVNGIPRFAIQDGRNIDENAIGQDLAGRTERRAVAGCNGDSDGYGPGDCYRQGDRHLNGKFWEADQVWFGDDRGPRYKGDWHEVRVRMRLNTIRQGVGQRDGLIDYRVDGIPVIQVRDAVFRTGQFPQMKIDQFLMAPYFGPGVPHPQTIWIDDLRIYTGTPEPPANTQVPEADTTWGRVKKAH